MINGIPKKVHITILKQCGMCTNKWTYAKVKSYEITRRKYIKEHIDARCRLIED